MNTLQYIIEKAWENRELLKDETTLKTIREVIALLDAGTIRVAEPTTDTRARPCGQKTNPIRFGPSAGQPALGR